MVGGIQFHIVFLTPSNTESLSRADGGQGVVEIKLTQGYVATIDDEDAALVKQHRWRVLIQPHTAYAIARLPRVDGKQRSLYMHRLVLGAIPGEWVEHLDRNGLNNRRDNLRVRTAATRNGLRR